MPDGEKALSKSKIYPMGRGMLMIMIYKHPTIFNPFMINGHAIFNHLGESTFIVVASGVIL